MGDQEGGPGSPGRRRHFGLWSFRFPLVLVRTGRRLPVQALCERRVLVALTGYPRGGAPGPGRSFVTRATRNQREIWHVESGPSRVNAPLEGPVIPRSRRDLCKDQSFASVYNAQLQRVVYYVNCRLLDHWKRRSFGCRASSVNDPCGSDCVGSAP